jgi:hypothetical protein
LSVDDAIEEAAEEAIEEAIAEGEAEPVVEEIDVEPTTVIVEAPTVEESPVTTTANALDLADQIREIAREEASAVETRIMTSLPGMVEAYAPAPVVIAPEPSREEPDEEPKREHPWHRKLW